MNLVMIGSFKQVADAEEAKMLIEELAEQVRRESMRSYDDDPNEARFSEEMLEFFSNAKVHSIGPTELEQFNYDVHVEQKANTLVLTTDEIEVSAFLKLLIEKEQKPRYTQRITTIMQNNSEDPKVLAKILCLR